MAQLENIRTKKAHDPDERYQQGGEVDDTPVKVSPLDAPEMKTKLLKLEDWFEQERNAQAQNRYQMALDQDFYDGLQYSEDDAQTLMDRGQAPLVYNEIKPTIDWIVGTERRTKFDYNVLPRNDADVEMATIKRDVLKYISDINRSPFERSQAFKECTTAGLSWIEDGVRGDSEDDPIFTQHESWRNVWYDSNSKRLDLEDARYLFRRKVVDLDIAQAMFPDRKEPLKSSAMDSEAFASNYGDDYYMGAPLAQNSNGVTPTGSFTRHGGISQGGAQVSRRSRVELVEGWVRSPARVQKMRGDQFDGVIYDSKDKDHKEAVKNGAVSLFDALVMQIEVTLFCKGGILWDGKSPYKHNRFSLTPMWCFRRARDNAPYGLVRNIRDPQEDLNKRASKALFILSSKQVIAEAGAVDDWEELRDEVARPDGIIIKNKGKELEIRQDTQLAEEHIKLMDRDENSIRNAGGVTDENLGRSSNAQSGKAIIARQNQGSVVTAEVFDNYLLAFQIGGENLLSLSEQYYTMEKTIRIAGKKAGKFDWRSINQPQPDGTYLNDITKSKADFMVDEQDYRENMRQAMFEQMMQMVSSLPPEIGINLLDLAFEFSDMQGKDEIVARIRKINGQTDDTQDLTPEQQQAKQAADQQAQAAAQMQQATAEANLQMLTAKVAQIQKQTEKIDADRLTSMVTAMYEALQSGQLVASVPGIAPVADEILQGAGYQSVSGGQNPQIPVVNQPAQPPQTPQLDMRPQSPMQAGGVQHGIETVRNDGVRG